MFSNWTTQAMRMGWILILATAVVAFVSLGSASPQQEAAESNPTVDHVLDHPEDFEGQEVTLEGEIDHIYSPTTFAIEDDQDLFGEDQILAVSVMPVATRSTCATVSEECPGQAKVSEKPSCLDCPSHEAREKPSENTPCGVTGNQSTTTTKTTTTTTTSTNPDLSPIPAVEVVRLHDGEWDEGKLVSATGTIRMFDCAALQQEFGTIDWGSAPLEKFEGQPVLIIGARQYLALKQQPTPEEVAVVTEEEKVEVPEPAPAPPPVVEPAPAPVPEPAPADRKSVV